MDKIWNLTLNSGGKWSGVIGAGKQIRFTALEDGANLSMLLYHARNIAERYNMPDTLKAQHTNHLTKGNVLMSDNGRVLASIIEDDLGWHDTISGYTTRAQTNAKYGVTRYQNIRNDWLRCGEENFTMELVRSGLQKRDLVPNVNLFSKVTCDKSGQMHFHEDHCQKGASVTLRTDMDILLILSNTPHPLDPKTDYPSVPVRMEVLPGAPVTDNDICVTHCPENLRAFENTWEYQLLALPN
ncbi:urea amidolyase associated protein UAAP1 [Heyndrickxia coagulans]|uniref:Urea carboxylase-associated protein 2 n=1 Tax=Heyndrickxia coagulans 36D1 TaxID=345219 RepID=G2TR07_HEYCO|nr:urea amidolyase associated protein UAAP1 [Heyndrickxia coagulans]AEP00083.1 urea carboxylase-associated protein 2 [Heyndrickxia coagulans 36D1]